MGGEAEEGQAGGRKQAAKGAWEGGRAAGPSGSRWQLAAAAARLLRMSSRHARCKLASQARANCQALTREKTQPLPRVPKEGEKGRERGGNKKKKTTGLAAKSAC